MGEGAGRERGGREGKGSEGIGEEEGGKENGDRPCTHYFRLKSYTGSIVILSLRYSACKYTVTLNPRLRVTRGHRNRYGSILRL